jgi:putative PIN family toxin of toxin-antitoxin system
MTYHVILDTNVLIAGLRSRRGASFALLERLVAGDYEISVSVPLVLEYEAVARRQSRELGLTHDELDTVLDFVCRVAHHRQIFFLWRPFLRDAKDDMVLEVAVEAGCTHIVTFNLRDFVGVEQFGLHAITPGEFLTLLGDAP